MKPTRSSFFSGLLWLVERLCPGPARASRYSPTHRDARENPHGGIGPTSEATNRNILTRLPALVQIGNNTHNLRERSVRFEPCSPVHAAPTGPPGIALAGPLPNRSRVDGRASTPRECSTAPMEGAPDHHRRGRLPQIFSFGGSTVPPRRYTAVAAAVTPHG